MEIFFGSGIVCANPTGGNEATNPTPARFMTLQDVDITISQTLKELKGQYQFPDDVAPAERKITGKVGSGKVSVAMLQNLVFADGYAAGAKVLNTTSQTVPAATPYTVTVAPPNSGTFTSDMGVQYANGQPFTKVASGPTVGQYSVSGAVYTFAAADASAAIVISYVYSVAASGHTMTVNNQLMGYGPVFEIYLANPYQTVNGIYAGMHLFAARFSKVNFPIKRDDYTIQDFEFEAYPNASGAVMELVDPN